MGQYYKPILLDETKKKPLSWVYSHDIKHKYKRSDGKTFMMGNGLKLMEHSWLANKFVQTVEALMTIGSPWYMKPIVWAGDYADGEGGGEDNELNPNLYALCDDNMKATKKTIRLLKKFKYIVNHDKKLFVDKTKVPDVDGWAIHPLPLLTCEGNGRGGGDFRGESELVGSWARDVISIESKEPAGYTELIFDLKED